MTTTTLKKELHHAIDTMPDAGFLKAVYAMFKEYPVSYDNGYKFSSEEKANLDHQRKLHKAGKTKSYNISEVRRMVLRKLKK